MCRETFNLVDCKHRSSDGLEWNHIKAFGLLYVQDSCVLLTVGVMQHAQGALNLSVLSKELEARFLMCVMSLSHFCWLLCEDHGPVVEHITWKGAFKFLEIQPFFNCHWKNVIVWLLSWKMWRGRAVACNSSFYAVLFSMLLSLVWWNSS